jgi:hypothetical protein
VVYLVWVTFSGKNYSMQQAQESETFDIPGVGELRARPGTSTAELAGAVKVWHDKYQKAHQSGRIDGAIAASGLIFIVELLATGLYFYLRN